MLDPEQLKKIALAKRQEKQNATNAEKACGSNITFTQEDVASYSKDMENHVIAFAEDGYLAVDYQFQDCHPQALIHAVAQHFKQQHPLLMLIVSDGEKKITVSWDGNNYV